MVIKDSNICVFFIFTLYLHHCINNATSPKQAQRNKRSYGFGFKLRAWWHERDNNPYRKS